LKNTPQLLPGTFVKAEITGRKIPGLLRIPESAFTKQGLVWFVDTENQLRKYRLEPLFYGNGVVYVSAPESTVKNPLLVALSPNSSFVDGLSVQSRPEMGIQDDT
jgi:multidrug efflux pump subunit AcrA (membrane-fusion protein)